MGEKHVYCSSLWANYASVFLYLLLIHQCNTVSSDGIAPFITPTESDITVLPGEHVKLICQSSEPIHWRFHDEFTGNYEVHDSFNQQNNYPHQSELELIGVNYTYVGYFYCVKNSSEIDASLKTLVQNSQASQIYLFVDDPQHPIAPVSIPLIQGNQFDDITIPCKPTSKKWEVQLFKENDESHKFDSIFSETEGFRIQLDELADGGLYTCHTKLDTDGEFDIHFQISMNPGTKFVNKPIISSKTDGYAIEGGDLELDCTVEAQLGANFEIKWVLPNNNISFQEGRVLVIDSLPHNHPNDNYYYAVGKLIVKNLDKIKDAGAYSCLVEDDSSIRKSATLNVVKILGTQEPFIEITEPAGKYSLKVTPKIKEVKWVVEYSGYPTPTLQWRDVHGNEIPWSTSEQKSCQFEAIQDKRRVTLKIRNPRVSDSGYYTLYADNGRIQKEQKFQLQVINMSKKRPPPHTSTGTPAKDTACKSCTELITRLDIAEKELKTLRLQLKEARALMGKTRNEQLRYRDLYLNCSSGTSNKL